MAKQVTIIDVAKLAGVSVSTVSRVINKNPKVDPVMEQKVKEAILELNYIPNVYARGIRGDNTRTIAAIVPNLSDNFFSKVVEGITRATDDYGIKLMIFSCHGDSNLEYKSLKSASEAGISGLLYCPSAEVNSEKIYEYFSKDFPLIIVYRRGVIKNVPHIYHDNIKGGYISAKYLLRQGRRSILFIASMWGEPFADIDNMLRFMDSAQRGAYSSLDRLEGHIQALYEEGIDFDKAYLIRTGYDFDSGYNTAKKVLSMLLDFDAVICSNDSVAAGVLQALSEQKISVPEQVSIVGYDDSVFSTIARPTITSVKQKPYVVGYGSVEMLLKRMAGEQVSDRIIDVELVVRNSTSMKK